mmetsp:Transcript_32274/g.65780  ORF Transcript_32274/g.65780 Transcript_32274/m.65780 type:complete len:122 (-) Transcript_32274:883-1248(-)
MGIGSESGAMQISFDFPIQENRVRVKPLLQSRPTQHHLRVENRRLEQVSDKGCLRNLSYSFPKLRHGNAMEKLGDLSSQAHVRKLSAGSGVGYRWPLSTLSKQQQQQQQQPTPSPHFLMNV